jgi:RNA polymerase sigma-70 factor (ECF subfamily)
LANQIGIETPRAEVQAPTWTERIEAVYVEQSRELWAMFYAHCGNADRAYDAVQEAFLRLQQQHEQNIQDMRAWLLQVGRNWLRDQARRKINSVRQSDLLDSVNGNHPDPIAGLIDEEQRGRVRQALLALREEDRQALVLRYALAWSSQRISETMGATPAAIDMRLSRARKRLAAELESLGVHYEHV